MDSDEHRGPATLTRCPQRTVPGGTYLPSGPGKARISSCSGRCCSSVCGQGGSGDREGQLRAGSATAPCVC